MVSFSYRWTFATIGVVLIICSVIGHFVFPELVARKVREQLPLHNDSLALKKWSKISVPIYLRIYVYDIKNKEQFMIGEPPIVEERGPYTFFETRERNPRIVQQNADNHTIIFYDDIKRFYFEPRLSAGTLDDEVSVLNLPLVALVDKIDTVTRGVSGAIISELANNLVDVENGGLVISKRVRELLFEGYKFDVLDRATGFLNQFGVRFPSVLPNNTFGIFYQKNGTSPAPLSIDAGIEDVTKIGIIDTFKGRPRVPHWKNEYCNAINGTDASRFHPNVRRHEKLYTFNIELCRSLYFSYDRDSNVRGIPTYRFNVPKQFFSAPSKDPESECFCTNPQGLSSKICSTDGVLDVSNCKKGKPIVISAPHFLHGDSTLRLDVLGLNPRQEKHETFVEVEPITGLVLNAARRIQINAYIKKSTNFKFLAAVPDTIMPFIWVEESATADENAANAFRSKIQNKLVMGHAVMIILFVIGLVLVLIPAIFYIIGIRRKVTDASSDLKRSYSSLPTKETDQITKSYRL